MIFKKKRAGDFFYQWSAKQPTLKIIETSKDKLKSDKKYSSKSEKKPITTKWKQKQQKPKT